MTERRNRQGDSGALSHNPLVPPKMHHSRPPANPGLPCGAGTSLEDCYLAKCSQANDGQGPRDGSEMRSLKAGYFVEPISISGEAKTLLEGSLSLGSNSTST